MIHRLQKIARWWIDDGKLYTEHIERQMMTQRYINNQATDDRFKDT